MADQSGVFAIGDRTDEPATDPELTASEISLLKGILAALQASGGTAPADNSAPATVNVGAAATQILAVGAATRGAIIHNAGAQNVYLGSSAAVTIANGVPLPAGATFSAPGASDGWFGIVASGTADVRPIGAS